ncbi:TPA: hypothetical protein ACOELP_002651 [Enterobacter hormaechei]
MKNTFKPNQIELCSAIMKELSRQHRGLPADSRMQAVIDAANTVCAAYQMTDEEYAASREMDTPDAAGKEE